MGRSKNEKQDVYKYASWAIEKIGSEAVPALIELLKDENKIFHWYAMEIVENCLKLKKRYYRGAQRREMANHECGTIWNLAMQTLDKLAQKPEMSTSIN